MNARIALFVSLITVSAINASEVTIPSVTTPAVTITAPTVTTPGFFSRAFTTITYPLVWTTDTTLAVADSITNNTLGKITGTSYLQGGVLDNHKIIIGRLALLAGTIVAAKKAYNWYLAQQTANENADFPIDFTYNGELGQ